jgi:hypothetical protein
MTFRLPMVLALGAMIALACNSKPSGDDTDVSDTDTTVDTTVEDTDVADTDPVVCDATSDTDTTVPCGECLACAAPTTCATEFAACTADAECAALFTCVSGCTTGETCVGDCIAAHPDGQTALGPLQTCVTAACPNSCGVPQ